MSTPSHQVTNARQPVDQELNRWRRIYTGAEYFYGDEPGPVARRAVRYSRPYLPTGGRALDAGCGEGQDLAFLAERGYQARGIEFTPEGAAKARQFVQARNLPAEVVQADLREYLAGEPGEPFDLVLAVNSLQFLGQDASACLDALMERVALGGVLGLSLFACETGPEEVAGTVWFLSLEKLLERFRNWQRLEAAQLWQWNVRTDEAQPFVTLIARKAPASGVLKVEKLGG